MRKTTLLLTICAFGCTLNSFANTFTDLSGPYLGAQIGQTDMHYSATEYTWPNNSADSRKGFGRIYGGYNFSEFLAVELGYDYFGEPEITHPTGNTQDFVQQGFDLAGRINVPLNYGIGLYVKGGFALVHRGELESRSDLFADKDANNKITPFAGAGLSYDFTPKFSADVSFSEFASNGDLPKMYVTAFGISYKFNTGTPSDTTINTSTAQ